jgi:hypothetical protein
LGVHGCNVNSSTFRLKFWALDWMQLCLGGLFRFVRSVRNGHALILPNLRRNGDITLLLE